MSTSYLIKRTLFPPQITTVPDPELGIVVVIPCFNEPDLIASLKSLLACQLPECSVEIIVIINDALDTVNEIKLQHEKMYQEVQDWALKHSTTQRSFHIIYQTDLPIKKAGVGLARKIGMDEAAYRLAAVGQVDGIITGFDADSLCLANYFTAIENHFKIHPKIQACSIWYEHPLAGDDFDERVYEAITEYELHLRYFTLAKRYAAYPHAYETIGSSMAVRSTAYQAQGGMNTRKAGEDFYFLNKFITLGKLNELNATQVIPSPRISDRVPFGTGRAVGDLLEKAVPLTTYSFQSFIALKKLIAVIPSIYEKEDFDWDGLPPAIYSFLKEADVVSKVIEIRKNTAGFDAFEKRFFRWFDPFMLMKYVHFARDHYYPNISVVEAGVWVLENYFGKPVETKDAKALLVEIRRLWKSGA